MEDFPVPETTPPRSPLPEAGNDPDDPLRPEIDEENSTLNPPLAAPTMDMEATEDREEQDGLSDNESVLSEVDEAQFEDFDPANIAIEDRPAIAVDDSNVGLIGVHKRKRTEEGEGGKKKRKEARREKPKKNKKRREDDDDAFSGGEEIEGKRVRKRKEGGEKKERARARRATPVEDDESLTPEERRKRALDRAMDEALRNPNKRRRKADGIDLDGMQDAEIEEMRRRMTEAAQADNNARKEGKIVAQKLKLLPEVVSLLNRNNIANNLVDPDTNLLEAVRFFLEPLEDGSMPAYNIQRELFAALGKLPITKETLASSGVGRVVLFYTKSPRVEPAIKRQADKLLADWSRPILKRTDDWRKREVAEADYDPT
ncbi:Transcription factor iws1 [Coniosporium apollinis]|uniref:Transcription factor iws1 n=1 Tax=Coniosporium apollinis TaxID=61459 RepID=A0ABQ9NWL1_9PEZI|nr:Transcription factor iws1 [Coniosporium apollinis]